MLDDRTWLLIGRKMANEASVQELQELEGILKTNPELHFSLQAITELWQQSPEDDTEELETAYSNLLSKMNAAGSDIPGNTESDALEDATIFTYRRPFFKSKGLLALAAVAVIIISIWIFKPYLSEPTYNYNNAPVASSEISTRYGSKTDIILPDGSHVWLNAGSKITYDKTFGETARNVQLIGEAYFDVVHNAEKPFIIHTRAMDIRVLGTEFNVKSYPDEKTTETSLIRGSIEVTLNDKRAEKILLRPNEKLVVSNQVTGDSVEIPKKPGNRKSAAPIISLGSLNYFSLDSTILETSWVENRLVFEDESFGEIAVKMSRWYGVSFHFNDEEVRNLRFTGNFRNESLEDALKAMQITAEFGFTISDKHVTLTKH